MNKITQENIITMDNLEAVNHMAQVAHGRFLVQEKRIKGLNKEACHEVVANFQALLDDVDFSQELEIFRLKFYNRVMRKKLTEDLKAIYIGLWALALQTSFPQTYEAFFHFFMEDYLLQFNSLERNIAKNKIYSYREMILRSDVRDFNHISQHLLSFVEQNRSTYKADTLRLSLYLRTHYTFIFQRLV